MVSCSLFYCKLASARKIEAGRGILIQPGLLMSLARVGGHHMMTLMLPLCKQ